MRSTEKHLLPDTMLGTLDGQAKTRHGLCDKHCRIGGVYDNIRRGVFRQA